VKGKDERVTQEQKRRPKTKRRKTNEALDINELGAHVWGYPFMTSTWRGRGLGPCGRMWTGRGLRGHVDVHTENLQIYGLRVKR